MRLRDGSKRTNLNETWLSHIHNFTWIRVFLSDKGNTALVLINPTLIQGNSNAPVSIVAYGGRRVHRNLSTDKIDLLDEIWFE